MINFEFLNKSIEVTNGNEFKVLYVICNTLSLNNTNRVKIYRELFEDKCNLSSKQVTRITNDLHDKGIIIKDIVSDGSKKKNFYMLNNSFLERIGDKTNKDTNVPFNNIKEDINVLFNDDKEINNNKTNRERYEDTNVQITPSNVDKNVSFNNIDKIDNIKKNNNIKKENIIKEKVEVKPFIKKVEITKTYTDNNISKNGFESDEKALKENSGDTKTLNNPILENTIEKENSGDTNSFKNIDDGKTFNIVITDYTKTENNLNNKETNTIMESTNTERNIIDKMVENALKNVESKEERQIKELDTFTQRLKSTSTLHDFNQVQNDIIEWCKKEQIESVPLKENVLRKFEVMNQYFLSTQSKLNTPKEIVDDTNKKDIDDTNTQKTSVETIPIKVENIINTYQSRIAEVKNSNTIERLWDNLKDYVKQQNFTPSQQMTIKEKLREIENLKNERLAEVIAKSYGF